MKDYGILTQDTNDNDLISYWTQVIKIINKILLFELKNILYNQYL